MEDYRNHFGGIMRRHKKWVKGSRSAAGRVLAGILAFSLFGQAGAVYASAAGTGGGEKTAVTAEKDSTEEGFTEVITQGPVSGDPVLSLSDQESGSTSTTTENAGTGSSGPDVQKPSGSKEMSPSSVPSDSAGLADSAASAENPEALGGDDPASSDTAGEGETGNAGVRSEGSAGHSDASGMTGVNIGDLTGESAGESSREAESSPAESSSASSSSPNGGFTAEQEKAIRQQEKEQREEEEKIIREAEEKAEREKEEAEEENIRKASRARRAPGIGGTAFETGSEFHSDIAGIAPLTEITSVEWESSVPGDAKTVDVGYRHHHSGSKESGGGCYNTSSVETAELCYNPDYPDGGSWHVSHDASTWAKWCGKCGRAFEYARNPGQSESDCLNNMHPPVPHTTGRTVTETRHDLVCGYEEGQHLDHIYAWYTEDGVLHLNNPAGGTVFLNPDVSGMFSGFSSLTAIDLGSINCSKMSAGRNFLSGCSALESLTLPSSFRFFDESGLGGTQWHKDGESENYTATGGVSNGYVYGFERIFNASPQSMAGTYIKGLGTVHRYFNTGSAQTAGNMFEIDHPDDPFVSYCWAQHRGPNNGYYDRYEASTNQQILDILGNQNYKAVLGDDMRQTLIALAYYGFPNDAAGIQKKWGLSDSQFLDVTQRAVWGCSDGWTPTDGTPLYGNTKLDGAYYDLISQRFANIEVRENIILYVYISAHEGGQQQLSIEGVGTQVYGGVSIVKTDEDGNPLEDAVFTITGEDGTKVAEVCSDAYGRANYCRCDEHEGLAPGNYIVRETKAPDGYEKSSDYYEFSVKPGKVTESGRKNGSGTSLIRFSNKEIRPRRTGGLSVTKTSASSGSLLSGAVIAVYNSAGEKAAELTTGADGKAVTSLKKLEVGSYTAREIRAPYGYELSEETISFEIKENQYTELEFADTPMKGTCVIEAYKVISPSGYRMKKDLFHFELIDEETGKVVDTAAADEKGHVVFKELTFDGDDSAQLFQGCHNYLIREVDNPDDNYNPDTHVETVTVWYTADDGKFTCTPWYSSAKGAVFENPRSLPPEIELPAKQVGGGKTIEEGIHNEIRKGDSYTYDVNLTIPAERRQDYFRFFGFADTFPAGIRIDKVTVLADGADVTDSFRIAVRRGEGTAPNPADTAAEGETAEPYDAKSPYSVTAVYTGDLADAAFYGKTYTFHFDVTQKEEITAKTTFVNAAQTAVAYKDDENNCVTAPSGAAVTDGDGNMIFVTDSGHADGKKTVTDENGREKEYFYTLDPEKAVIPMQTNEVFTDVYPFFEEEDWSAVKTVTYSGGDRSLDTLAVRNEDILVYHIKVTNHSEKLKGILDISDPLPANVEFLDAQQGGTLLESAGLIVWNGLSVAPQETKEVTFRVKVPDTGSVPDIDNRAAAVITPDTEDDRKESSSKNTNLVHNYVPSIVKKVTDENGNNVNSLLVMQGTNLVYHLFVTNSDSASKDPERTGKHRWTICDTVPDGTVLVRGMTGGSDRELSWTADFEPGETKEFTFTVKAQKKGKALVNFGILTISDEETGGEGPTEIHSNKVINEVPEDPRKSVETLDGKDVNLQFLEVGETYRYTITIDNQTDQEKLCIITDKVPEEITDIRPETGKQAAGGKTAQEPGTWSFVDGTVTFALRAVPGEKTRASYSFSAPKENLHFTNKASVELTGNCPTDPLTGEKEGEDHPLRGETNEVENWTPVSPVKKVFLDGEDADGRLLFGENRDKLLYEITFKNTSDREKKFTVTDRLSRNLSFLSAGDGGRFDEESGTIIWECSLNGGEEKTVRAELLVSCGSKCASAENRAQVRVDSLVLPTGETKTEIDETPVKTVLNGDGEDINRFLVGKGEELIYEIFVKNPAPDTKRFTVEDAIPDNTVFVSMSRGKCTSGTHRQQGTDINKAERSSSKTLVWTADIGPGETWCFAFTVRTAKKGAYIPNDAKVTVDGSSIRTNLVENWTMEDPMKAVTADGSDADGKTFVKGEETALSYVITVKNPASVTKTFTVTDVLDGSLVAENADNGGVIEGRTVKWEAEVQGGKEKKFTVHVHVLKTPLTSKIENKAEVSCDEFTAETNTVTVYLTAKAPESADLDFYDEEDAAADEDLSYTPETGDEHFAVMILSLLAAAGSAALLIVTVKRRRKGR